MLKPDISLVLGSYNRQWLLELAIESVRQNGISVPYEMIVVDGGSTDGALEWLIAQKDIVTIVQHNREVAGDLPRSKRSWGYFMNLAFKCAQGKYILMISDDCILHPGAIMSGYRAMELAEPDVAACAFYFRNYPAHREYRVGSTLGDKLFVNHGLFRRDAAEAVGWLEEDRYSFYHADGDFGLKLWERGYRIIDCPDALVEHFVGDDEPVRGSNKKAARKNRDWQQYLSRWSGIFYDPESPDIGTWYHIGGEAATDVASAFDRHRPLELRKDTLRLARGLKQRLLGVVRQLSR